MPSQPGSRAAAWAGDLMRWVEDQLVESWRREGEAAERGFRLGRPVVSLAGVVVLAALGAEALSALALDQLWWLHLGAGLVLLPLLAVKLAPVALRVTHYYGGATIAWLRRRPHRLHITPPLLVARLVAPLLLADTVLVLLSGMLMWRLNTRNGTWSTVHNASAIAGAGLLAVHLAYHVRSSVAAVVPRVRPQPARDRHQRLAPTLVAASLLLGLVVAVFAVPGSAYPQGGNRDRFFPGAGAAHGEP